jgi:hypothetical protein
VTEVCKPCLMNKRSGLWVAVALSFGCAGDDAPPLLEQPATVAGAPVALAQPSASAPLLPELTLAELDELRDPFEAEPQATLPPIEREGVAFADTPVRSLKVSGTIDGVGDGKAIIAGVDGETEVLSVGARIGQLEKTPDGMRGEWRIDSVRNGRVYLLRDGGAMQAAIVLGEPVAASGRKRSASKINDRPSRR